MMTQLVNLHLNCFKMGLIMVEAGKIWEITPPITCTTNVPSSLGGNERRLYNFIC